MKYTLLMFLLLVSTNTFACRCIAPDLDDSFDNSESVVLGKVLEIAPLPDYDGSISIIKVTKSWKNVINRTIAVISITNCSFAFEKDKEYVIYVNSDRHGLYSTDKCSGTKLIIEGNELFDWLDTRDELPEK